MLLYKNLTIYPIVWFFCCSASIGKETTDVRKVMKVSIKKTRLPLDVKNQQIFTDYQKDFKELSDINDSFKIYKKIIGIFFKYCIQLPSRLSRNADAILLPTHITQTNDTHKGINLKFADSPPSLLAGIEENMRTKPKPWSTRYIFATHGPDIANNHFTAIDVHAPAGGCQVSVIQLEPASFLSKDPNVQLAKSTLTNLFKNTPNIKFYPVSVSIQNSLYDCAMCSLQLVKYAHKNSSMIDMHKKNISEAGLSEDDIYDLLPIKLMKQQQSGNAINTFLSKQHIHTASRREELTQLTERHSEKSCERIVLFNGQRMLKRSNGSIEEKRVNLVNQLPSPTLKLLAQFKRLDLSADSIQHEITSILQDVINQDTILAPKNRH